MYREPFFKIDDRDLGSLRLSWENLARGYGADQTEIEKWFNHLTDLYSARGRAYHNLSHIRSLLSLSDPLSKKIQNYDAVRFAIWFHDAVYNTRRKDNEDLSAELAFECLTSLKVPSRTVELVRDMILATKDHRRHDPDDDLNIFLDLDLSILGSGDKIYQSYSKAIRKEYWWVPSPVYRRGRRQVLENFLTRDSIYFTDEMAQKYERQARLNIKREIEALSE
jgi:predicted metal-dependent HD superfamily phosphohydrolase